LPDALPEIHPEDFPAEWGAKPEGLITLISTFSEDEPIEEVIQGFSQFLSRTDSEFGNPQLWITGKKKKGGALLDYESDTIRFTDFLSQTDFDALIQHSALIIDLTTREDCLVCGAYEALAVETPVLLSDTEMLRTTFQDTALYAENNSASISSALEEFFKNQSSHAKTQETAKEDFISRWRDFFEETEKKLTQI